MTNSPLSPYLIAGLGAYHVSCTGGTTCGTATRFGWNAGAGSKIAALGFKWFVEARYNRVSTTSGNFSYVPVTLGLIL